MVPKVNSTSLPPIDLSTAKKPELTFWHAQEKWGPTEFDKLRVYYKVNKDSAWVLLKEFLDPTYDPEWVKRSIFIPDSAFSSTFYLGFEGESNWGWGVCIDDIEIVERGVIPMQVKEFDISQPSINLVPTRSKNNPVLKIHVNSYGNTGKLMLDSISVKALNTDNTDISVSGVKLFYTDGQSFIPQRQVDISRNIGTGIINFSNINFEVPYGDSYFWVTFDIDSAAMHHDYIDASVPANGIKMHLDTSSIAFTSSIYPDNGNVVYIVDNDTSQVPINYILPNAESSPIGERQIEESLFYDEFEKAMGWTCLATFR